MAVLLAFTLEHASRATGISERRIRYWDDTGVLSPSLVDDERGGAYSRIYSFRDLVGLRTIAELRDRFGVSLQGLRAIGERLKRHADTPWSELRFYVSGQHLFFKDPETELFLSALKPNQIALAATLNLVRVEKETRRRANRLVERTRGQFGQFVQNRYIAGNRTVIAGTRIPTAAIWEFHEAGYDEAAILKEYPRLVPIDVKKAIEHERSLREVKAAS
jgi:DNA-binding transcriptional MerR regulator